MGRNDRGRHRRDSRSPDFSENRYSSKKQSRSKREDSPGRDGYYSASRKRAMDAAKARLQEKLSTAITDLKDPKFTTTVSADKVDHHKFQSLHLSAAEVKFRQDMINQIDSDAFVQSSFESARHNRGQQSTSSTLTDHEKAMFGAQWQSKALEKKLPKSEKAENEVPEIVEVKEDLSFPLAGEKFFEDPKIRQERWLQLFKQRRKEVLASNDTL